MERTALSGKPRLWFDYDAMGNRVRKETQPEGSGDAAEKATQFYLRDPQGNVIAIYTCARVGGNDVITLTEQHIYGSARLGLQSRDLVLYNQPSGGGIGGGNRTGVLDSTGKKGIVITEIFPESLFGDTDDGKIVILGNVSADRILLDGLYLADGSSGQYFAVPDGYLLDSAEKLVIGYGPDSLQDAMVSWLGWPADTTLQWIWQDGFVLSDSGELELIQWDGESALSLDFVQFGENGLRRTFAGREAEVAGDDFESGGWSLGTSALERKEVKFGFGESYSWTQMRGGKNYELSDHLGNVAVVVGDRRLAVDGNVDLAVDFFEGEILSARDFYPFGMVMPERSFSTESYRYGFNGKEFDSEWKGEGNSYDYGFRVHDARLGRFLSVDPLALRYPMYSPFQFAGNSPIRFVDIDGLEPGDPQNFRHNVLLLTPLPPTGPLQGLPNPVMYFADGYWILQFENSNQPGHHLYYYQTGGNNMVKFWDSYEIEAKRREVWLKSVDIMAKIFVIQMEIALMGPEMIAEGILEKGAEFLARRAVQKYGPKLSKWIAKGVEQAKDTYGRLGKKARRFKPCGCFTEGTLVLTANGLVPIEEITVGDSVWARNDSTGETLLGEVLSKIEIQFDEIYKIYIPGEVIEATFEHPFFVDGNWIDAKNLRPNMQLMNISGILVPIDSLVQVKGRFEVYNFVVDSFHTYFVSNRSILVHNPPCEGFNWQKHSTVLTDVLSKGIHGDVYDKRGKKIGEIGFELSEKGDEIVPVVLGIPANNKIKKSLIEYGNKAIKSDGFNEALLERATNAINSGNFEGKNRGPKLIRLRRFLTNGN